MLICPVFRPDGDICCKFAWFLCIRKQRGSMTGVHSNTRDAMQFSSFYNYSLASKAAIMAPKPLSDVFTERAVELRKYIFDQPASRFTNNPQALANSIEDFANQVGHMMIFQKSKVNIARGQLLIQRPVPRTIIEYGTFVGTSALAWAAIVREIYGDKVPSDVKVYSFDPDAQMVALAREFVKLAGVEDLVHVFQGEGSQSLKNLYKEGKVTSIDMAFFDHREQLYLPDLKLIEELNLWRVGSLAVADNTDFPGAPDYLDYVRRSGRRAFGTKYETNSLHTTRNRGPSIVEVSRVVALN
ncbi:unnamed protein product [Penicillium salamii]|uniref:catechol O-methyltransferase n=1 Tax=Penicillium salamii TaxID=1612424 RepID=A0A9W4IAH3_9EURO|nr:unnamed protein product [Penicillium salamii]CAG7965900.1 unnamed protein product [Penicillium salamii]CAG7987117.1 unnamed protein product [Penicillium salamii]CAG8133791.1 unnamed protein product [Penicillium salamii]CAG8265739.1 unnamed protein product [Penicillium salamii]